MGLYDLSSCKSAASAAKNRERKRRAKNEDEKTQKLKAKRTPKHTPTSDFPVYKKDWTRADCLEYFKDEPTLHPDLVAKGYKKVRSEAGNWFVQSPGKEKKPGRIFMPGSARLKKKSIPHHIVAPTNVLCETEFTHVSACIIVYIS